jgi:hypothetical protein
MAEPVFLVASGGLVGRGLWGTDSGDAVEVYFRRRSAGWPAAVHRPLACALANRSLPRGSADGQRHPCVGWGEGAGAETQKAASREAAWI